MRKVGEKRLSPRSESTPPQFPLSVLDTRKNSRESRERPWTDKPPKRIRSRRFPILPVASRNSHKPEEAQPPPTTDNVILASNWETERQEELAAISRVEYFKPITVVVTSKPITVMVVCSHLKYCTAEDVLICLKDDPEFIHITYNFYTAKYQQIIDTIKRELEKGGAGLRAERIILLCQGGGGHLFILNNQIIAAETMADRYELRKFWFQLGSLVSKRDVSTSCLLIGGCNILSEESGRKLLAAIKNAVKPNKATISVLPPASSMTPSQAKNIIGTVFIHPNEYKMLFTAKRQTSAKGCADSMTTRTQSALSSRSNENDEIDEDR